MATDIERVLESVTGDRREVERIAGQTLGMEDTQHMRELLTATRDALAVAEFLLGQSKGAEKFWQVRKSHGI